MAAKSTESLNTITEMTEIEFDELVSKDRIDGMVRKMQTVEEQITHLQKVRNRWGIADSVIKITGVTLTFILSFLTAIVNVIPNVPSVNVITTVLSSLTALFAVSTEGTVLGFTSRNKVLFSGRIRELEKKYNRCYLFYEKARSDKKITVDELERFYKIFDNKEEV